MADEAAAAIPPEAPAAPPPPSIDDNVNAIIAHESGGDPNAVGDSGLALGLGQMHPEVRAAYGVTPNSTPEEQKAAIKSYFTDLLKKRGNVDDAVAEYHLGATNYDRDRNSPDAQAYVAKHHAFLGGTPGEPSPPAPPAEDPKMLARRAIADPKFWQLDPTDRVSAMAQIDPAFKALAPADQTAALEQLKPADVQAAPAAEKPPWYSGLADEAGDKFATAVHNAVESFKSLAGQAPDAQQHPENITQVVHDVLGLLEPWTTTGEMTGIASRRAAKEGGFGPTGQAIAGGVGTVAGAIATPAPPGFGIASRAIGRLFTPAKEAVPEAVNAARAEAPEAAAAAETVAGKGVAPGEAPAAAREVLAPSGATTSEAGPGVKTALTQRTEELTKGTGDIYDAYVAAHADETIAPEVADQLAKAINETERRVGGFRGAPGDVFETIRDRIRGFLPGAEAPPYTVGALNDIKTQLDSMMPAVAKTGVGKDLNQLRLQVRNAIRSGATGEEAQWLDTADTLWRDELRGAGMTETSLGNLTKLIKKTDPAVTVDKLFGSGTNDRQGAIATAVFKHLDNNAPEVAKSLREAVLNRAVTDAENSGNFAGSLLKNYDAFSPMFKKAISNPDTDAFFTVLRNSLAGGAESKPGTIARLTAHGIVLAGGEMVGKAMGHPYLGILAAERFIPPSKVAAAITDPRFVRLLTRALQTPVNSAIAPTLLKQITTTPETRNAA